MARTADYEGRLLASILRQNDQIPTARAIVSPEMLKDENYRFIYRIILDTYAEKGSVDSVLVTDQINDYHVEAALRTVIGYPGTLTADKVEVYAKEIIRRSQIGKIHELADKIKTETKAQSDITDSKLQEIISSIHAELFTITGDNTFIRPTKYDVVKEMKQDIVLYAGKELWGFDTGWDTINQVTRGIAPQQLWVVGAYTSVGKSWFSLKLAANMISRGIKVLYLSTEMSEKRLYWRLATILTELPEFNLIFSDLPLEEHAKRKDVMDQIQVLPIEIRSGISDVNDAMFEIRKGKTQGYADVVIIDFLQNLAGDKDEYQELSVAVRKLQNLAIRENVAIVLASQNNRESQKQEVEALYGFKGSGAIETCADVAIVLSRIKANDRKDQYLVVDILKNRNGLTGQVLFTIDFQTGRMQDEGFYNKEQLPQPLPPKQFSV